MPGLVPGIHVFNLLMKSGMAGAKASGSDAVLQTPSPA